MSRFRISLLLCLLTATSCAGSTNPATPPTIGSMPQYESVADPPGVNPTRILVEGNVLHFGNAGEQFDDLIASDIGFPLYFVRVAGGIRARAEPILFPDGDRAAFQFDDFSCVVAPQQQHSRSITCTSIKDGREYRSRIESGGLVEFETRCLETSGQVCRYRLVGGPGIRPSKVEPAS